MTYMKRILALAALLTAFVTVQAQEQSEEMVRFLSEFPQRAAFNTHSYEFTEIKNTPAPMGYEPFYISHYGRHGSRSDWAGNYTYKAVRDVLSKAKADDLALTPAGDSLLRESALIYELYDGMDGRLTPRGVREHAQLANRMYHRFPAVFKKGSRQIRAVSSTVPRCLISMNGFTAQLKALDPGLQLDLDTGEKFFAYIAKAENGTIRERTKKELAGRPAPKLDIEPVLRTLFQNPDEGRKYIQNPDLFLYAIYATAKVAEANDINDNLFRYLPLEAVYYYHEQQFLSAYLNQCNSELNGDLRMPLAKEMADTLIVQADRVISGTTKRAADLTFGHDWPFLGLCSYFGLEGIGDRLSTEDAAQRWMSSWNCPFAANLQIIFYHNRSTHSPVLVKFLVNERETAIPALTAVKGPYYKWDDVKAYCATRVPHTQIVAHRGYWKENAQNSIASLSLAQEFGCWGSECDIHLTADEAIVVNHDRTVKGTDIQKSTLEEVRAHKLKNGELIPTLEEYLVQADKNKDCVLVIELKPNYSQEREDILIEKTLAALKSQKLLKPDRIAFISFSYHICKELAQKCPGFTVQYLEGDKTPAEVFADGINGIDYHYSHFQRHPEWVKEAHDLGMSVNAWTVDSAEGIRQMKDLGVDQITTNDPALTREILFGRQ